MSRSNHTQAAAILRFYQQLRTDFPLPSGISVMNPYADRVAWPIVEIFYRKFYADSRPRAYIMGINPGRFGGGVTGIPFTDPIRLQEACGIPNDWKKSPELSSQFIYEMIGLYGGVKAFYGDFYITALSPLGFVKAGKNLNYYDDKTLLTAGRSYMIDCIRRQLETIPGLSTCFCLGEGENFRQLSRLNQEFGFFETLVPLPHPRWVMQYRRKRLKEYAALYVEKFREPAEIKKGSV